MEAATQTPEKTAKAEAPSGPPVPPPRLRDHYESVVLPALIKKFGYTTPMSAPRLLKVTVNMGVGEASRTGNVIDDAIEELSIITGQRPNIRRARKSIAAFKLREGMPVGVAVTLRTARMWEFVDRLVSISIPRIRDFRGLSPRAFDGRGNYSLGVREQLIFPEIDYDSVKETRGLDIAFATTAKTDEEGFELLLGLGFPFGKDGRPGSGNVDAVAEAEEEKRKEEARMRAEAEQAALEQLKEENPEAYEKPVSDDAEGDDAAEESAGSTDEEKEE
jgi:large subunit ribosomal protein L5